MQSFLTLVRTTDLFEPDVLNAAINQGVIRLRGRPVWIEDECPPGAPEDIAVDVIADEIRAVLSQLRVKPSAA